MGSRVHQDWLAAFPRVPLLHGPTPLERLNRLSQHLGGPLIWVKRDDCTGLAGGGNKVRKLEFLLGAARQSRADVVITAGAIQSNHARQTAAAANRLGMRCVLVLTDSVPARGAAYRENGNVLLNRVLGAEVLFVGQAESDQAMESIADRERRDGGRPFVIPTGGSSPLGALGYIDGFLELRSQLDRVRLEPAAIVLPTGSGGTQAGLMIGSSLSKSPGTIIGVSVGASENRQSEKVARLTENTRALLSLGLDKNERELVVNDHFIGAGYGQPTQQTIEAIEMTARTEGLFLDPVYTGKAMAGLIGLIRAGRFQRHEHVVFLHTGGAQALSAYPELFQEGVDHGQRR